MEGSLPTVEMPFVWADFNSCGWAGAGDDCFYALAKQTLDRISPVDGMSVFVWDDDGENEIIGCVARLERATLGAFAGWRARPISGTFYRGPKPSQKTGGVRS